jgi:hypothetical protein
MNNPTQTPSTVSGMLFTKEIRCNQSKLAKMLGVNRGTLRKYMDDPNGVNHCIRLYEGKVQLMVKTHGAANNDY